jgi:hypothetical protein
MGNDAFHTEEK